MKTDFEEYLRDIDKGNINEVMLELPSQVFDHNYHYATISSKLAEKKDEYDTLFAQLSAQVRSQLESKGTKAFTESRIKDLVISQNEIVEMKSEIRKAEKNLKICKAYIEALKTAREVLPNVSNNYREERRATEKLTPRERRSNK